MSLRLREIQVLLSNYQPRLVVEHTDIPSGELDFTNRVDLICAMQALAYIPTMAGDLESILMMEPMTNESTVVHPQVLGPVRQLVSGIASRGSHILAFLNETLPEVPEFYFAVKFPNKANDTQVAATSLHRLYQALDMPVVALGHPALQMTMTEPGSLWVELKANAPGAMVAVGLIIGCASDMQKVLQEVEKTKQEVEKTKQAGVSTKMAELRLKIAEDRIEVLKLEQSSAMEDHSNDPEVLGKLQAGVATTIKLLGGDPGVRGETAGVGPVEFRLQLDLPQEMEQYFPEEIIPGRGKWALPRLPRSGAKLLPE